MDIASDLAKKSEGLSGAEIVLICREAGLFALSEGDMIEKKQANEIFVEQKHLEQALVGVLARGTKKTPSLFN
jgi:SpoVK/Ycf46/Vps4 family AAA+-type ATPase